MPELPEVETVKETLKKLLIGKTIKDVLVFYKNIIGEISQEEFINEVKGQTINDIKRKGKFLIFCLDDKYLLSHLRMEGKYFIKPVDEEINKHEHIVFLFDDFSLRYHDTRKFGVMLIRKDLDTPPLSNLGFEPWDLTIDYLKPKMNNKPIKELLLDQSIISGLGNIYADEVCAYAHIHPKTPANSLNDEELNKIIEGSKVILEKAILAGGTTIRSYLSSLNVSGRFQQELIVHTKDKCGFCQGRIVKIRVGGRGTYYCPYCQKDQIVVGLTGGIACGKSTVAKMIKEKYPLIDSDLIVKDLYNSQILIEEIKKNFDCVKDNIIDKKKLAEIIFNDEEKRLLLNSIIHPMVLDEILKRIKEYKGLVFIDVPLLFESGYDQYCDYTICVYLDNDTAIKRLMTRNNYSYDEAKSRVYSQMDINKKKKLSTFVIDNTNDIDKTYENYQNVLKELEKCQ